MNESKRTRARGRLAAALGLIAALAACHGADYWDARVDASPLHRAVERVSRGADCTKLVPMEFGRTYPVPAPDGKPGRFQVLFYPSRFSPGDCAMASPAFAGEFSVDAPAEDRCRKLDVKELEPLGRCMPEGITMTKRSRAEAVLFESLEPAAALYAKGGEASAQDRRTLAAYVDSVETLVTPPMRAYYYRQNPAFWEWLRKNGGRSLTPP